MNPTTAAVPLVVTNRKQALTISAFTAVILLLLALFVAHYRSTHLSAIEAYENTESVFEHRHPDLAALTGFEFTGDKKCVGRDPGDGVHLLPGTGHWLCDVSWSADDGQGGEFSGTMHKNDANADDPRKWFSYFEWRDQALVYAVGLGVPADERVDNSPMPADR